MLAVLVEHDDYHLTNLLPLISCGWGVCGYDHLTILAKGVFVLFMGCIASL